MVHEQRTRFEGPKIPPIPQVEPASGKDLQRLESDCEKILSMETITGDDFNSYTGRMMRILGTSNSKYIPMEHRISNAIQQANETLQYALHTEFRWDPEDKFHIVTQYSNYDEKRNVPDSEIIRLNDNPDLFDGSYFTKITYNIGNIDFTPQYFNSVSSQKPLEVNRPYTQEDTLNRDQTLSYMRLMFDIYKSWRDSDVFEVNLGGKTKVDFHRKENHRVWTPIENSTPQA